LKCAPPVRTNAERALLREHLGSTVTMLASDHAPCPRAEKETGDIFTDYGGMPGVQLLLPYALHLALAEQLITLEQLVRLTSAAAAERFGVDNRKGGVAPGLDADVVLVDPEENWRVEGKRLHSKGSLTPFEGHTLRGRVIETWLRGQRAWDGSGFAVPSGTHIKRKGA
jgi:dihydroorotase-like cyclic amidohydrolase